MKMLLPTCLVLAGCWDFELRPEPEPGAELGQTPVHGVWYYGRAEDAPGIDEAASLWLEWCGERGVDPSACKAVLERTTVSVLTGVTVDGEHSAWWHGVDQHWISVARDASGGDEHMNLHHEGLMWLRHEWLHELYQDASHAQFPGHN